jgi:hypothetical protein
MGLLFKWKFKFFYTLFQFIEIGKVVSIENNHKPIDRATRGMEVCIKIEAIPGDAPKMFGRHFDETDLLYSKVNKSSSFLCNKSNSVIIIPDLSENIKVHTSPASVTF